jgi:DNA-binding CsgD family transcriptional regulator/GAF domain-containing protein
MSSCERVRDAIERLAELGPVSEIIERAVEEAASAIELDRVLLSRIENGALVAERLRLRTGDELPAGVLARLQASAIPLEYPLIECELLRRHRAALVADVDPNMRGRHAFLAVMGWTEYVAAPVVVEGRTVGFLHGDRGTEARPLADEDADALAHFASGFALVFERAVLRRRLRTQRAEIRRIAGWAEGRAAELSDGVVELSVDRAAETDERAADRAAEPDAVVENGVITHLTSRERDVLKLMAGGKTNGEIARSLVVTQGTVKFHVKNVLRKMQASNRADATSRYLRLTLGR